VSRNHLQVQYLHPKDGVYPEKVNAGRSAVNANKGRIGENLNPVQIKFSGKLVSAECPNCSATGMYVSVCFLVWTGCVTNAHHV
jgi:PsaD